MRPYLPTTCLLLANFSSLPYLTTLSTHPISYQDQDDDGNEVTEMWQEACWHIISSYFAEKGLVIQQLESFDQFILVSKIAIFRIQFFRRFLISTALLIFRF